MYALRVAIQLECVFQWFLSDGLHGRDNRKNRENFIEGAVGSAMQKMTEVYFKESRHENKS